MSKWLTVHALILVFAAIVGFAISSMIGGCASVGPRATHSVGTVLQVDGDLVLVSFPVATEDYSDQAANWFYIPGHSYQVRDTYPDPDKDPSLQSWSSTK